MNRSLEEAFTYEVTHFLFMYGFVSSYGICIDDKITLGDLIGIIDQMDAMFRGYTD